MHKKIFAILLVFGCHLSVNAQIKGLVKDRLFGKKKTEQLSPKIIGEAELNRNTYSDKDRLFKAENGELLIKGNYKRSAEDRLQFSGFYYLNTFGIKSPDNHFSKEKPKAYNGFSVEYNPENYTMNLYWEEAAGHNGVVLEQYQKSADKGNIMFQLGISSTGPSTFNNMQCLMLEPGVLVMGVDVYYKNDQEGHYWMNNIEPKAFVLAVKDTSKFAEYQSNIEHTSKVIFEKYDALRRVWMESEIASAKPLPKSGMKNSKLKADALSLIKKTAKAYQWKEEIEYAYIESTDWNVKLSILTGLPLSRSLKCIVVMKSSDGNYKREGFYIGQKYQGNGYGKTYMLYNDQRIFYVNPKEVNKYR
ncbi:MAG: hypothetical protein N4A45_07155 [Flavobacteriales bacterium]|jgi:hypothetical protein|nr:hypothetical protein [Flavobacteriales bacterium]